MSLPFVIIGSGGHARVLLNLLQVNNEKVICFTEVDKNLFGKKVSDIKIISETEVIEKYKPDSVNLVLGIGVSSKKLIVGLKKRVEIAQRFESLGYSFPPVIHSNAIVSHDCILDNGAQVMAGAVIQPGCKIGEHVIINTACSIDHDGKIDNGCHIGPGSNLAGSVNVYEYSYVGIGSTIVNDVSIGKDSIIGAGAVVTKNVPDASMFLGVPAEQK